MIVNLDNSSNYGKQGVNRGVNRAEELEEKATLLLESGNIFSESTQNDRKLLLEAYIHDLKTYKRDKIPCVFISHRSCDKDKAQLLGNVLNKLKLNIYLDKFDIELQQATKQGDMDEIVWHIEKALIVSTRILILLSTETEGSWWVPYEIGYAKCCNKKVTSLRCPEWHPGIEKMKIPDYLQIEEQLIGERDFIKYANTLREIIN